MLYLGTCKGVKKYEKPFTISEWFNTGAEGLERKENSLVNCF